MTSQEEIFKMHPRPWRQNSFLILDVNGQQVIHLGGCTGRDSRPLPGDYLCGLGRILVEQVNLIGNDPLANVVGILKKMSAEWEDAGKKHYYPQIANEIIEKLEAMGWNSMDTAPKDARWLLVKMKDNSTTKAHYAEDLSGSDQPLFRGWFTEKVTNDGKTYFYQINQPVGWKPLP